MLMQDSESEQVAPSSTYSGQVPAGQVVSPQPAAQTYPQPTVSTPLSQPPSQTMPEQPLAPTSQQPIPAGGYPQAPTGYEAISTPPLQPVVSGSGGESGISPEAQYASSSDPITPQGLRWEMGEQGMAAGIVSKLGLYGIGLVVLSVLVYLVTRDIVSTVAVLIGGVAFLYFATNKIASQQYALEGDVLYVGDKPYKLTDFKSFSIAQDAHPVSVVLAPLRRFMPPITLFVPDELVETVSSHLAALLPNEQHKVDAVDSLLHKLRR